MSLITDIQSLADCNTLQEIADSLNQIQMINCYGIYEQENGQEPDSILEALDFIINTF